MESQPTAPEDELRSYLEDAFEHVDWLALQPVIAELIAKHERSRAALGDPAVVEALSLEELAPVLDGIFVVRRHRRDLLRPEAQGALPAAIAHLLHGEGEPGERIAGFLEQLQPADPAMGVELATDLLHFYAPERHWLWTRWLYHPVTRAGILPVLLEGDRGLRRSSVPERYLAVGRAIALVSEVEDARRLFDGTLAAGPEHYPFAVDVFLAAAWGSYLYGVTAWRLTREFHKLLPPLPRLTRRLFGLAAPESPSASGST